MNYKTIFVPLILICSHHSLADNPTFSFGCNNPPFTSSQDCVTAGIKTYESSGCQVIPAESNSCRLTAKPVWKRTKNNIPVKGSVKKVVRTWECTVESSNCADYSYKKKACPKNFSQTEIIVTENLNTGKVVCISESIGSEEKPEKQFVNPSLSNGKPNPVFIPTRYHKKPTPNSKN